MIMTQRKSTTLQQYPFCVGNSYLSVAWVQVQVLGVGGTRDEGKNIVTVLPKSAFGNYERIEL